MPNPALVLASLLIASSLPGVLHGQAPDPSKDGSALTPGDSVWIIVWRRPDFTGEFAVAADGSILHPLYRTVMVGGVPLATAEANLRTLLEKFDREPVFVMMPLLRVAVVGEVNRPSMYALGPKTTISEAIARAGGPTQFARLDRVQLLRSGANGGHTQMRLDLANVQSGAAQMPIRSGDQILVERKRSVFSQVILPTVTILGALASIGIFIHQYQ
jgi:protein involved in polysaccharide export with SLBB domain